MQHIVCQILVACLFILVLSAKSDVAGDAPQESVHSYRVVLDSSLELKFPHETQQYTGTTELQYTRKRRGQELEVSLNSVTTKATKDGVVITDTKQSRTKVVITKNGVTKETLLEKLPEAQQKTLQATFGVPLLKLKMNENHNEVERTIVAGPDASWLFDNNMMTYILLMHPPFHANDNEWVFNATMSAGREGVVKIPVTYSKTLDGRDETWVKLSGNLTADNLPVPKSLRTEKDIKVLAKKNIRYIISGEMRYDVAQREWVAGKLTKNFAYEKTDEGREVSSTKGTLLLTLAEVPEQKSSPVAASPEP